jgi:hypothetical protein
VLCLGETGIANTTTAATLCAALFGGTGADWAGPGTGVKGAALVNKIAVIDEALAHHKAAIAARDPLALLASVGGEEFAAIAGAVVAARVGRIPVLLDGYACTAAAAVLYAADHHALDHCRVAHHSAEPGHKRLLDDRPASAARHGHAAGRGPAAALAADPQGGGRLPQNMATLPTPVSAGKSDALFLRRGQEIVERHAEAAERPRHHVSYTALRSPPIGHPVRSSPRNLRAGFMLAFRKRFRLDRLNGGDRAR